MYGSGGFADSESIQPAIPKTGGFLEPASLTWGISLGRSFAFQHLRGADVRTTGRTGDKSEE